jgi:hypothetical protein
MPIRPDHADQAAEALHDLIRVFYDPGCFGECSVADAARSLEGTFTDADLSWRLGELVAAEERGDLKAARRHLRQVEKVMAGHGITPLPSEPLIPDSLAVRLGRQAARNARSARATSTQGARNGVAGAAGGTTP